MVKKIFETRACVDVTGARTVDEPMPPVRVGQQGPEEIYLKHSFCCLPDSMVTLNIDHDTKLVTLSSSAFDSGLYCWLVGDILPKRYDIVAFRDDNLAWHPPPAPYRLRIRLGKGDVTVEFVADAVLLMKASGNDRMSIRLSDPQTVRRG